MRSNRIEIDVNWGDCDPAGIVFYPQFFRWFDQATWELFAAAGVDPLRLEADHGALGFPILDAGARFRSPGRFRDRLTIESAIEHWGRSSFRVVHAIRDGEREVAAGHELRAWVVVDDTHPSGIRAVPVPGAVKALFAGD